MPVGCIQESAALLAATGFREVEAWLDPNVPTASLRSVRDTLASGPVRVFDAPHSTWIAASGNRLFQRAGQLGSAGDAPGPVFEACFESVVDLIPRCATFVALVQHLAGIDSRTAGRLRFVVTELCANAVDHAVFIDTMRIELAIVVSSSHTLFVYRDNAEPFVPNQPREIDVAAKIARGDRRGLGLFMLNRVAQVRHRRHGKWNETTVLLAIDRTPSQPRSSVMDEFKLDQIPCQLPDTVVLKPIGSIDSTSVHMLDAKLATFMSKRGVRLVVDLSSVTFLSSAGVGAFLGTAATLRAADGDLFFLNPTPAVTDVFDTINLSAYFKTVHTLEELQPVARH
jgi:anti-anti-sigma factor